MEPWVEWTIMGGRAAVAWVIPLMLIPLLVWMERKASAYIQDRTGPNRAAILGLRFGGIIHALADVVKLVFKEDITPAKARPFWYNLAPMVAMTFALLTFAALPFADVLRLGGHEIPLQALRLNPGLLWMLAIGSFGVFGIVFAGWGSNSSYPLLGGIRSSAQMISYELSLGLSVVGILMIFSTVDLNEIVRAQGKLLFGFLPMWGVIVQPVAALIFMAAALAEANRNPFDLMEADSEIVAFHLEYSSLRFALFMMTEYVHITVASGLTVTLFFGGWQIPWLTTERLTGSAGDFALAVPTLFVALGLLVVLSLVLLAPTRRWHRTLQRLYVDARRHEAKFWTVVLLLQVTGAVALGAYLFLNPPGADGLAAITAALQFVSFMVKVTFFGFVFIWVRWTLPRFRYDQLMALGWKGMLPLALANVVVTGFVLLLVGK
jgi:NADH-quinone oxidoreductase subunit H